MTGSLHGVGRVPGELGLLTAMGAVFVVASGVFQIVNAFVAGVPASRLPFILGTSTLLWVLAVMTFVPGLLLAERAAVSAGRAVPYTVLVLGGSALVAAIVVPLCDVLGFRAKFGVPPGSAVPRQLVVFATVLTRMGLASAIYAAHRTQLAAVQAFQALVTRRNETLRRLAASRLQVARARVQPEVFVAELRAIRASYRAGPAAGGAELEALITRLRTASRGAVPEGPAG